MDVYKKSLFIKKNVVCCHDNDSNLKYYIAQMLRQQHKTIAIMISKQS